MSAPGGWPMQEPRARGTSDRAWNSLRTWLGHGAFVLFVALDGAALGLVFVLGLAAAAPSHTPVLSVMGFFMLPALLLAAMVWLYQRAPWRFARPAALLLVTMPALVLIGSVAVSLYTAMAAGVPIPGAPQ